MTELRGHLGVLREPDRPQEQGETRGYSLQRYLPLAGDTVKLYKVGGDHIYLSELNSSDTVMVRLSSEFNPWIPMEEGDVIVREFTQFWVRSQSRMSEAPFTATPYANLGGTVEATFYVSRGPLYVKAPKKYGFRAGFLSIPGTATVTGADAFANFGTAYGTSDQRQPAYLKYGGTIIIDNRDPVEPLYVYQGEPGGYQAGLAGIYPDGLTSLRVPPDTAIQLQIENRIANLRHPNADNAPSIVTTIPPTRTTLVIACETGLPQFVVTLSRYNVDFGDPESIPEGSGLAPLAP